MPAVEAPGRKRPITRSHAPIGLMQQRALAGDQRLLLHGYPDIRRIATQCVAEKTRAESRR